MRFSDSPSKHLRHKYERSIARKQHITMAAAGDEAIDTIDPLE